MMSKQDEHELSRIVGLPLQEIGQEYISVAEMQRHIMPTPRPLKAFNEFDVYAEILPIAIVGGDYCDVMDLEERFGLKDKMGITIADAAGHGLAAAMLIRDFNTALYTAISFQSHYEKNTTPLMFTKINRRMYRSSRINQFISCFYGELNKNGELRYINAGHYDPFLVQEDRTERLSIGGPVLGAFRNTPVPYQVGVSHFAPGDVLVAFTDGIVEAVGADGTEYGVERLEELVRAERRGTARSIFRQIIQDVDAFAGASGQSDDRTIVVVKRREGDRVD